MGLRGHWPKECHEIGVNENLLKTFITRLDVVLVTIVISLFHFIYRSHMCKDLQGTPDLLLAEWLGTVN